MHPTSTLGIESESSEVDNIIYRQIIGSLLYLKMYRPNILFSVYLCACFQSDPKELHFIIVKCIFHYLIYTLNLGLCFKESYTLKFWDIMM